MSWFLKSDRVERLASGVVSEIYSAHGSPLVEVGADDSPHRNNALTVLANDHASIEIPAEIILCIDRNLEPF